MNTLFDEATQPQDKIVTPCKDLTLLRAMCIALSSSQTIIYFAYNQPEILVIFKSYCSMHHVINEA